MEGNNKFNYFNLIIGLFALSLSIYSQLKLNDNNQRINDLENKKFDMVKSDNKYNIKINHLKGIEKDLFNDGYSMLLNVKNILNTRYELNEEEDYEEVKNWFEKYGKNQDLLIFITNCERAKIYKINDQIEKYNKYLKHGNCEVEQIITKSIKLAAETYAAAKLEPNKLIKQELLFSTKANLENSLNMYIQTSNNINISDFENYSFEIKNSFSENKDFKILMEKIIEEKNKELEKNKD